MHIKQISVHQTKFTWESLTSSSIFFKQNYRKSTTLCLSLENSHQVQTPFHVCQQKLTGVINLCTEKPSTSNPSMTFSGASAASVRFCFHENLAGFCKGPHLSQTLRWWLCRCWGGQCPLGINLVNQLIKTRSSPCRNFEMSHPKHINSFGRVGEQTWRQFTFVGNCGCRKKKKEDVRQAVQYGVWTHRDNAVVNLFWNIPEIMNAWW